MHIIDTLKSRGLFYDSSDPELSSKLKPGDSCYVGFDPSAPSLQLGNLVPMLVLIHLARAGYKPIMLFGGATGSIGDPSGRNSERQLLSLDITENNLKKQVTQASAIYDRAGVQVEMVNNMDWTRDVRLLDFLRDVGKHFTVNYMLSKEVVKSRLEGDGISYTEFSYMLLQSFDFLHLYQTKNCKLEIGGSDQWGNITAGLELIRRKLGAEVFAFSFPLILDSQGRKFGKSAGGALWLDGSMTSPYRFHQFMLNVEDSMAVQYLKVFTFLSLDEIAEIEREFQQNPGKRLAQKTLADQVCALIHGEQATADARRCAEVLFGGDISDLNDTQLLDVFQEAPSSEIPSGRLAEMTLLDLIAETKLVPSRGEGKKLLAAGGIYVNSQRSSEPGTKASDLLRPGSSLLVLRSGKKTYHLVKAGQPS